MKTFILSILLAICSLFPIEIMAWQGMPTPPLHVEGNKLKDPTGKDVLLHGWMQPTASWFNGGGRWYSDPNNWKDTNNVAGFLDFMCEIADLLSDTTPRYGQNHGWYGSFVRLNTDGIGGWNQQVGLADTGQFNAWINNFLVPYANYLSTRGLYLVLSAVGPINTPDNGTRNAGVEEQQRLLTLWSTIAGAQGVKDADNIMFELMNEPVDIESSPGNGDWGNHQDKYFSAFTNWIQPIIDTIRSTGSDKIIWVPTLEWQGSPYQWDLFPFSGTNIGVACHYYPAYGGVFDNPTSVQNLWNSQYKPAADRWPMIITELFWTPYPDDPWNLVNGKTEGFGNAIKKAMDDQGNVSYIVGFVGDLLESLNDNRPADCDLAPREGAQSYFLWQHSYASQGPDDGTPELKSASVDENNPKQIKLLFNHATKEENNYNGFMAKVDTSVVTIDSVIVGDSTNMLIIYLSDSIFNDQEITLSYNNGNVVSIYDKDLANFTDFTVNNLLKGASPRLLELKTNVDGDTLIASFNKKMKLPTDLSDVTLNAQYNGIINIPVLPALFYNNDSMKLALPLNAKVFADYQLSLSYSGNNIISSDSAMLKTFSDYPVTNRAIGMTIQIDSGELDPDGFTIILSFSKPLSIVVGKSDDFMIEVNGSNVSYDEFYVSNNTIRFKLSNNLHFGDTVKISYVPGNITATDMGSLEAFNDLELINPLSEHSWYEIPGKIEAENFILQSGTSTENTGDSGGGLNIGWVDNGDWLEYAIDNNTTETKYRIYFRVASTSSDARIDFYLNNRIKGFVEIPNTGGWQSWRTVDDNIRIPSGKQYLKVVATTGGFNLNYMEIKLDDGTGINVDLNYKMEIYPNPVSQEMIIYTSDFKHNTVDVFDITGNLVLRKITNNESEIRVPVQLPNGVYIVKIGNGSNYKIKRIVINN